MSEDGQKTVTASAISYKKRPKAASEHRNLHPDTTSPQTLSAPSTSTESPNLGPAGTRKISSRRKALQDYYKLQSGDGDGDRDGDGDGDGVAREDFQGNEENTHLDKGDRSTDTTEGIGQGFITSESNGAGESHESRLARSLANEESFRPSLKQASLHELVRARNWANNRLNHHDSEKKSIIYDNYSDLIKLNDVLNDIHQEKPPADAFSSGTAPITNQDVDAYLNEIATFLKSGAAVFNQDFASVVQTLCEDTDGAESIASVKALRG